MNLITILPIFIIIPFAGFLISLLVPQHKEALMSRVAFSIAGIQLAAALIYVIFWLLQGYHPISASDLIIYDAHDYRFYIDLCFDKISLVYLLVGSFLTFLVTIYSRYYLHREKGYKRFFNTVLFFFLGYNLTILSGNFETLFIGWEVLGISSFLLIAYYRERYLPVRNAVKVFSLYRIGDIAMILAMWASHHFWHKNISFLTLTNEQLVDMHLQSHAYIGIFISMMILLAAAIKSAQLPFSSWLPRAMEGPTPSSAIFYGSMSVHIGVFLLLRTEPFWHHILLMKILIGILGLFTSIVANSIARVQSSVKSQIAYASITQIGLIFIEIAFGLDNLALMHFAGNAFLRTYQLLVSPSVVSYLIKEQFNNFIPRPLTFEDHIPRRLENTFFILSLKEWNLDALIHKVYWQPLKWIGRKFEFVTLKWILIVLSPIYAIGLFCLYHKDVVSEQIQHILPFIFAFIGLIMVFKSFAETKSIFLTWTLMIMNHFWIALALGFNENFDLKEIYIYLSGIIVAGLVGYFTLRKLQSTQQTNINLHDYQGYSYQYPKMGFVFLLACLGLSGFPITPTFLGEDLIFSHIHSDQIVLVVIISMSFIVDGLSIIRMYSKIFMGPSVRAKQEMALRSS